MRILLEDKDLLKSMGIEAKSRAEKNFGIENLISSYSELYRSLLSHPDGKDKRA